MALLQRRLKGSVDRRRALAGIPGLRPGVEFLPALDGGVLRTVLRRSGGFFGRFAPPESERRYELDAFGAFVVRQMQQGSSVLEIVRAFHQEFGMSPRECELSVVAFVHTLINRNLVSVQEDTPR